MKQNRLQIHLENLIVDRQNIAHHPPHHQLHQIIITSSSSSSAFFAMMLPAWSGR